MKIKSPRTPRKRKVLSPRAQELDIVEASRAGLGGPLAHQGQSSKVESRLRCDPMEMGGHEETANRREALLPTPAPSSGKSWASIVDGGRLQANMDMPPLEKKEMDGKRRLTISQQSYEVLCQPFRFSAIATLAGGAGKGRLDYSFIFTSLKTLWPEIADLRFTSVGKGLFLLCTSSEADLHLILSPGRWYVGGRLLIANQWHPGMPMRIESSNKVRIWIRLPDLPVEWWNPRIFTDIAELIGGSFVEADDYTRHLQRFGFARIRIEIPLGFCPTSEIELEISGGKVFAQSIEYETKVKYCIKCGSTAHFDGSCTPSEAPVEGEKLTTNGWQTVKTPRRRSYNKEKEIPTKQNKFQALELLEESETTGDRPAIRPDERDLGCKEGEAQGAHKTGEENRAEVGVTLVAPSSQLGTEESDSTAKLGGHMQESSDLSMLEVSAARQDGPSLDKMDEGVAEAKSFSDAMEEESEDGCSEDQMASREGTGGGHPCL
ncbi:hypothetical protein EJ110_NYTH32751 [Nymphaea thermarum]|nr:hypothetical protein EJ110_NYTH32751 [Nymphaea thermarum]